MQYDQEERLTINPLFVGLTRPPMLFGVTMDYLGVSLMIVLCAFILCASPLYLLLEIPLYLLGVMACAMDHNIFRLLFKKLECLNVPNKKLWGCQSYEPY